MEERGLCSIKGSKGLHFDDYYAAKTEQWKQFCSVCVCVCDDYSFIKASTFKPFVHNIQVNLVGLSSENVCVCDAG